MEISAFERSLKAFANQTPFRPFTVELITGEHLEIAHLEALVTRGGVAIFFAADGEMNLFNHDSVSRFISSTDKAESA
jgi:hypothetical protein